MRSLDRLRGQVDRERQGADKKFRRAESRIEHAYGRGRGRGSSSSSDDDEGMSDVRRGQLVEDYTRMALHTERQLQGRGGGGAKRGVRRASYPG